MSARLYRYQDLQAAAARSGFRLTPSTLRWLVWLGYTEPSVRRGAGRLRGRSPHCWTRKAPRQIGTYTRLRRAGLRGDRLAFALWWETGNLRGRAQLKVRRFTRQVITWLFAGIEREVFKGRRLDEKGKKIAIRRYLQEETLAQPSPADVFGEERLKVEMAAFQGLLGLLTPNEPLGVRIQKLVNGIRNAQPGEPLDLLRILQLLIRSLAAYGGLQKVLGALDEADDATFEEARRYLRNSAARFLRQSYLRKLWRNVRSGLNQLASYGRKSLRRHPIKNVMNGEAIIAIMIGFLLLVDRYMREGGIAEGLQALNAETWGSQGQRVPAEPLEQVFSAHSRAP